ncbi:PhaM family polyhydroxyalkanoate granule multifunctional regulatory protein [Vandammella animalimorsus]|uniref:PhaM family polyhydroxyalkanoate granule multifunctional regulatory protein n=1 Tax=Vandammella animalimorsus TaxID=2029117 RepID=UPI001EEEE97C|nr:PhaM family polyhydroxyalkanoate granule multifunctional regulatory protein [Vandammella animalimorsus]
MSEQSNWMEFTRFVPGFDFLRNLAPAALGQAQGQSGAAGAAFQQWLAPTMDPAEVQKRIDELKVVKFWLEQNGRALEATIQALEVQKMTLSALGRMNRDAREMAQAFSEGIQQGAQRSAEVFQAAMPDMPAPGSAAATAQAEGAVHDGAGAAHDAPQSATEGAAEGATEGATEDAANPTAEGMAAMQHMQAQALQWWGALTEQFQAIAAKALDDIGQNVAAAQTAAAAAPAAAPAPATAPRRPRAKKAAAPAKAKPKKPTARAKAAGAVRGSAQTRAAASPKGPNLRDGRKAP